MVQMPALNTPQFGWVKSRLKRKAKPVPPIFQPEVGARAIYWAAHHGRRELYVGWPTVEAIEANKVAPGAITTSDELAFGPNKPPNPKILIGPTTCGNRSKEITGPMDALTTAPTKRAGNSK